ncbi:hypothetical protein BPNPMPFG_007887 (plasmid) [Mesorhizobium sp. AR07]|uniref:ABC transporter permease n=1 Tax=Mesorhizobium sp. AR07 TaxID=2865838 RepID=UPI00215F5C30|nr:hypothetical protein [Mesorhizobium sp. AR07]UVK48504.1 hypothetical protein BPNPMPFG_007887 [Mesorhizobium sp. AR07]
MDVSALSMAGEAEASARIEIYNRYVEQATGPVERLRREIEVLAFESGRRKKIAESQARKVRTSVGSPRADAILIQSISGIVGAVDVPRPPRRAPALAVWSALWGLRFHTDMNSDRLGMFWWLVEPLLHVILITFATLLLHGGEVFDMPAFPFAVIGVIVWLTFRTTFLAALAGPGALVHLIDHPDVSRFDVIVGTSVKGVIVNSCIGIVMLGGCVAARVTRLPENPLMFAGALASTAALGLGSGLIAYHGSLYYPGLRKIYVMILRIIATFSGLFFVSEQVPGEYAAYVLWNPILHLSQFARSGWFYTYDSTDASFVYVFSFLCATLAIGFGCAVMDRRARARHGEYA